MEEHFWSNRFKSNECADTGRRHRLWNIAVNIERYAKDNHINLTFNKRQSFPTKTSLQYQYNGPQWTPIKLADKEQYTCYAKGSAVTVSANSAMFSHHVPVQLKHFIHHRREVSFLHVTNVTICHRIRNAEYRDRITANEMKLGSGLLF